MRPDTQYAGAVTKQNLRRSPLTAAIAAKEEDGTNSLRCTPRSRARRGMQFSRKRVLALVGGMCAVVSFARVSVLFLESLATVRDERAQDQELLDLCASGSARSSQKMRTACLQAQSDRASPILLKAILHAVSTAFDDFAESVSSPWKLLVVVLFVVSSVFLPANSWARALFVAGRDVEGAQHVVVVAHDSFKDMRRLGFKRRVSNVLRMRKPMLLTSDEEHACDDPVMSIGFNDIHTKWD